MIDRRLPRMGRAKDDDALRPQPTAQLRSVAQLRPATQSQLVTQSQPTSQLQLEADYRQLFCDLHGDTEGRFAAQDYLDHSTALYHGEVIGLGFLPKLYDQTRLLQFDELVGTTWRILEKVTRHYQQNAAYRQLFGFSNLAERLIMLDPGYSCYVPIMRIDLFLDEGSGDFWFCEFNTDGSSGMNEDREGADALWCSTLAQQASGQLGLVRQELFDSWVECFLVIWQEFAEGRSPDAAAGEGSGPGAAAAHGTASVNRPIIAIADYLESASMPEFEEYRRRFEQRGYNCLICNIPALRYERGRLIGSDVDPSHPLGGGRFIEIDAVYRRAVTGEILSDLEKTGSWEQPAADGAWALVQAARDHSICLVGGFRSHVAHTKQLFAVLCRPETASLLSAEEQAFLEAHLPYTEVLSSKSERFSEICSEKDNWIIKPQDGYASQGVFAGRDHSQSAWEQLLHETLGLGYVAQHYAPQYATSNCRLTPAAAGAIGGAQDSRLYADAAAALADPSFDPEALVPYNILTGLYGYGGRFAGIFVRAGQSGLIVGYAGGISVPALLAGDPEFTGLAVRSR